MSTITQLETMAELYEEQGDYINARELYKKALVYKETQFGQKYTGLAEDLYNLGLLYFATDQHAEAERLLLRALALEKQAFGPEHPNVNDTLSVLEALYGEQRAKWQHEPTDYQAQINKQELIGLAYT